MRKGGGEGGAATLLDCGYCLRVIRRDDLLLRLGFGSLRGIDCGSTRCQLLKSVLRIWCHWLHTGRAVALHLGSGKLELAQSVPPARLGICSPRMGPAAWRSVTGLTSTGFARSTAGPARAADVHSLALRLPGLGPHRPELAYGNSPGLVRAAGNLGCGRLPHRQVRPPQSLREE